VAEPGPFLTAEWRDLAMLNYEIDAAVLRPFVPAGTELDAWGGRTFVSVVGFRFLGTRVRGVPVPGHRDFEELNLRFYVRRVADDGPRRGVVFGHLALRRRRRTRGLLPLRGLPALHGQRIQCERAARSHALPRHGGRAERLHEARRQRP
jgi:uncharacterized protein YqjF (DUF2071 family)